jgi:hypothetical protein
MERDQATVGRALYSLTFAVIGDADAGHVGVGEHVRDGQLTQLSAASAGVQRQQWEPVGGDAAGLGMRRQLSFPPDLVPEESRQLVVAPRPPSDARSSRDVESGPWAAGQ